MDLGSPIPMPRVKDITSVAPQVVQRCVCVPLDLGRWIVDKGWDKIENVLVRFGTPYHPVVTEEWPRGVAAQD